MHNVAIIGSGPAAYTAAIYVSRAQLEPVLLEGEFSKEILPGGQLMTTTEIENFPGFPDGLDGSELMDRMKKQAIRFGTHIESRTVTAVDFSARPFKLMCGEDAFEARAVIAATGATARYLGIPSEQAYMNRGVSACATCDGALPRFRNKEVVVVGGGDTAMEEATFLTNFVAKVHLLHRRDQFRASKIMGERVLANPKIQVHWFSVVDEILGGEKEGVTAVRIQDVRNNALTEIPCVGFFAAIGHKPNTDIFKGVLDMDETGYLIARPGSTYTNVEGVFAAGDVQDKVYRQAITAAGSGCMAALDAVRWLEAQGH